MSYGWRPGEGCGSVPSWPRAVGSVPSFPIGADPFGIEPFFGASAVDIGAAFFIWFGCAGDLDDEPLGALAAGARSALNAGTAQKVAAAISAHSCWLFTDLQPNFLPCFAAEPAGRRDFDRIVVAHRFPQTNYSRQH